VFPHPSLDLIAVRRRSNLEQRRCDYAHADVWAHRTRVSCAAREAQFTLALLDEIDGSFMGAMKRARRTMLGRFI
jgi:hypothetical protein